MNLSSVLKNALDDLDLGDDLDFNNNTSFNSASGDVWGPAGGDKNGAFGSSFGVAPAEQKQSTHHRQEPAPAPAQGGAPTDAAKPGRTQGQPQSQPQQAPPGGIPPQGPMGGRPPMMYGGPMPPFPGPGGPGGPMGPTGPFPPPPHMMGPPPGGFPMQGPPPPMRGPPGQHPGQRQHQQQNDHNDIRSRSARYVPLPQKKFKRMSKLNMAYVIRSQLSHLQSSDPFADDFYYQVYTARKGQPEQNSRFPTLGAFARKANPSFRNPDGTPKLPKDTLGRIAASSLRKPKRLLDLGHTDEPEEDAKKDENDDGNTKESNDTDTVKKDDEKKKFMFSKHSLSFLIEAGIRCLMDIEDVDSIIVSSLQAVQMLPPDEMAKLDGHRKNILNELCTSLDIVVGENGSFIVDEKHIVYRFMAVPKGRLLIFRALLLLPFAEAGRLIHCLMWNLRSVAEIENKQQIDNKLADVVADILSNSTLGDSVQYFRQFLNEHNRDSLVPILQSQIGCLITQVFLKKAHDVGGAVAAALADPRLPEHIRVNVKRDEAILADWRIVFDTINLQLAGSVVDLFKHCTDKEKPGLAGRDSLWELLAAIVSHSSAGQRKSHARDIRKLLESEHCPLSTRSEGQFSQALRYLVGEFLPADHRFHKVMADNPPRPVPGPGPMMGGGMPMPPMGMPPMGMGMGPPPPMRGGPPPAFRGPPVPGPHHQQPPQHQHQHQQQQQQQQQQPQQK